MLLDIIKNYSVLGVIGCIPHHELLKGPSVNCIVFIKNFLSFYDIPILFKDERMPTYRKIFINNDVSKEKIKI